MSDIEDDENSDNGSYDIVCSEMTHFYDELFDSKLFIKNDNIVSNCYGDISNLCFNVPDGQYCNQVKHNTLFHSWMIKKKNTILFIEVMDKPYMNMSVILVEKNVCVQIYLHAEHRGYQGAGFELMRETKRHERGYDFQNLSILLLE